MRNRILVLGLGLAMILTAAPVAARAQAPPPPPTTFWRFLGIPQACSKVNAQFFNRRGNTPCLESHPPLRALSDPANLAPDMPKPIQAAAKIKQAEDLAPQKKKAIKYLAEIGCGCYDKQGEVTDALVAAMDDCTETVRLEAVDAIKTAASGDPCCNCGSKCCCNMKILKKLAELAYARGDDGCCIEPSERVRDAAAEALTVCCTTQEPIQILEEQGGSKQQIERPEDGQPQPATPSDTPEVPVDPSEAVTDASSHAFSLSSFVDAGTGASPRPIPSTTPEQPVVSASPEMKVAAVAQKVAEVIPRRGEVAFVNASEGTARVVFGSEGRVPEGTTVQAYHKFLFGSSEIGQYVVIAYNGGEAIVRRADGTGIGKLSRGDMVLVK